MQLQSLVFMLFMLVVIPMLILTSNHNAFFLILSIVIFIGSLKNIHTVTFNVKHKIFEDDDESMEDLESLTDVDLKKLGTGLKVAKNLIVILFFIYCTFYINTLWFKLLCLLIIVYWVVQIRILLTDMNDEDNGDTGTIPGFIHFMANAGSIFIILVTAFNKFIERII